MGWNQIIPAAGNVQSCGQTEHAVSKWISMMVIEQQPSIELLFSKLSLNLIEFS